MDGSLALLERRRLLPTQAVFSGIPENPDGTLVKPLHFSDFCALLWEGIET